MNLFLRMARDVLKVTTCMALAAFMFYDPYEYICILLKKKEIKNN